jgi:hypothetical protein
MGPEDPVRNPLLNSDRTSSSPPLEDYPSGGQPLWRTTPLEDYPSGGLPLWRTTPLEDYPCGGQPLWRTTPLEDYPSGGLPLWRTTPLEDYMVQLDCGLVRTEGLASPSWSTEGRDGTEGRVWVGRKSLGRKEGFVSEGKVFVGRKGFGRLTEWKGLGWTEGCVFGRMEGGVV